MTQGYTSEAHLTKVDPNGLRYFSDDPLTPQAASRMGAVNMGISYAVNALLGTNQPSLMLKTESDEEMARQAS